MAQDQMPQKGKVKAPERAVLANLFDITGPIVLNYSRSSFAGPPLLSYKDADLALTFQGDEITRTDSPVTFTPRGAGDPDGPGRRDRIRRLRIETTDCSFAFMAPPGPAGVLQASRFHQLHGFAQLVDF